MIYAFLASEASSFSTNYGGLACHLVPDGGSVAVEVLQRGHQQIVENNKAGVMSQPQIEHLCLCRGRHPTPHNLHVTDFAVA